MFKIGFLFLLCSGAQGQVPGIGACPQVEVVQNFDASRYLGVWYEIQKYFAIFEWGGKCITANYTQNSDGSIKVVNCQINILTGKSSKIEGNATFAGNKTEGKLSVVFPSVPGKIPAPYWILDTDYENYSVVYSCGDISVSNAKIVWILARQREPAASVLESAYKVLDKNKLSRSALKKTNQRNCTLAS